MNRRSLTQERRQLNKNELTSWLTEKDTEKIDRLFSESDRIRKKSVGDEVHFRGLIEISNHCVRQCHYCGLRNSNRKVERYRMGIPEIIECVSNAESFGYGTIVVQAGEDPVLDTAYIEELIGRIKNETGMAVTLSLGERRFSDLEVWRKAGADRYFLRFETSDIKLYNSLHPPGGNSEAGSEGRLGYLAKLRKLGYEVGSGVMVGLPGQTYESLADDLLLFSELGLDMIGLGPFIPNPDTPLRLATEKDSPNQLLADREDLTYRMIALTRILCPQTNIPSTTALCTLNPKSGRVRGLQAGANVVMPNITPLRYRQCYQIYPGKAGIHDTAEEVNRKLKKQLAEIGRKMGSGRGDSPAFLAKTNVQKNRKD